MAIPLIQNVEKQDINTSIIAIRRQLEQLYNALGVTENTVSSEDISKSTGTPLGTIVSYLGTENPANGEWLICDGSTFDASQYPSLATFLGGNVLPEVFDHSRPSDYESITISYSSASQTEIPYEGVIVGYMNSAKSPVFKVYVNDVLKWRQDTDNNLLASSFNIPVKKGDKVYIDGSGWNPDVTAYAIYYKNYKLIKAVSSIDSYTPSSSEIQEIEQYIDNGLSSIKNNLSLSETETPTGRKFLNKPTYTKVFVFTSSTSQSTTFNIPYADNIIEARLCIKTQNYVSCSPFINISSGTSSWGQSNVAFSCKWSDNSNWSTTNGYVWFEYTKSTD